MTIGRDDSRTLIIKDQRIPGNHTKGRSRPIDMIVVHVMEGTMAGTLAWFRNPEAEASAHYGISRSGEIVQYVRDADTAWHAGRVDRPTAPQVIERPGVNPNSYSIGIENEGTGKEPPTEAQVRANVELIRWLCSRYAIPISRRHIVGHREIYAGKACPGMIDVLELVARAQMPEPSGELATSPPAVPPVDVRKIIVPRAEHVEEVARVRRFSADQIRPGLQVAEVILRAMQLAGVRGAKTAADGLSEWLTRS